MFLESSLCHYQRQSLVELIESYDEPIVMACVATTTLDATAKAGTSWQSIAKCGRNSNQLPTQSMGLGSPSAEGRRSDASQPTAFVSRSVPRRPVTTILVLREISPLIVLTAPAVTAELTGL